VSVDHNCLGSGRIDGADACDVGLGIGQGVRVGKEIAKLRPDAAVVRSSGDRCGIVGTKGPDDATRSDELAIHPRRVS
jgi:hypothetical protein